MPFQKGHKYGKGRPKGSINSRTYLSQALKEKGINFLDYYLNIVEQIEDPSDRAQALKPMMEFIYTKPIQDTSLTLEEFIHKGRELIGKGTQGA